MPLLVCITDSVSISQVTLQYLSLGLFVSITLDLKYLFLSVSPLFSLSLIFSIYLALFSLQYLSLGLTVWKRWRSHFTLCLSFDLSLSSVSSLLISVSLLLSLFLRFLIGNSFYYLFKTSLRASLFEYIGAVRCWFCCWIAPPVIYSW